MGKTRVVNLYKEPYDVYIGRPGKGRAGPLGNPIVKGLRCPVCEGMHTTPGDTLPCYEKYLEAATAEDPAFMELVMSCEGKSLGCFCHPKPCHGDVLVRFIESRSVISGP